MKIFFRYFSAHLTNLERATVTAKGHCMCVYPSVSRTCGRKTQPYNFLRVGVKGLRYRNIFHTTNGAMF